MDNKHTQHKDILSQAVDQWIYCASIPKSELAVLTSDDIREIVNTPNGRLAHMVIFFRHQYPQSPKADLRQENCARLSPGS